MSRMRHVVTLLSAATLAMACNGEKTITTPVSISLNIDPTSISVPQGGEVTGQLTLTRLGGFDGTVDFSVTGAPAGIATVVSDVTTPVDQATTATLTIDVDPAVAPGTYALVVHGDATEVTEATATVSLTVTPAAAGSFGR